MRFTQFLIEADQPEHGPVQRDRLAREQRNRRATKRRAADNNQALSANATAQGTTQFAGQKPAQRDASGRYAKPTPSTGFPQRPAATSPDTVNLPGTPTAPESKTGLPQRPVDPKANPSVNMEYVPQEVLDRSKQDRQSAVEFMTLLGSMYQAKRKNPQVELTTPKMVEQSKNNKPQMAALFKAAQKLSLPQLAQMTQEIKKVAATPGSQNVQPQQGGAAPAGQANVPQVPGQTPAQQTVTQNLANKITQAAKSLPPASLKFLKDLLGKSSKKAKENPMQAGRQQATNAPVMTQG